MIGIHIWDITLMVVSIAITFVLLYFFLWFDFILIIGLVVLSVIIADFFIKIFRDSLPGISMSNLSDKAVLITGCDTGFGNLLARQLDAKGVTVFAGCLFADGPDAIKLKESCSQNLRILQLDVTKDEHVKTAVKYVIDNLGDKKLWAIVNNAGIGIGTPSELTTLDTTKKTFEVNTFGVVRVTQAFLPLLRRSKGRVVIVASAAGRIPSVFSGSYCMSKFATVAYAEILRMEMMRWNISVHTIEPWIFVTCLTKPENAFPIAIREWNLTPESVKQEYGGDSYLEEFKKFFKIHETLSYPESKVYYVVDCMMDATIGKYPKLTYVPGIFGRIILYLYTRTLTSVTDLVISIFLPKIGGSQKK